MNEFLIVRLSNNPDESLSWLVWSHINEDVVASGELQSRAELADLLHYSHPNDGQARPVVALVPSSQVLLTQLSIPKGASRQLDTMLPFLMEDMLTQDIHELHFSILKKQSEKAIVASLSRDYLAQWIDDFKQCGISLYKVLPDVLALPYEGESVSAIYFKDQWLLRQGEMKGASVDEQWLGLFLNSGWLMPEGDALQLDDVLISDEDLELTTQDKPASNSINQLSAAHTQPNDVTGKNIQVHCFSALPANVETLPGDWQMVDYANLVLAQFATGAVNSQVNLLTGEFKSQAQWRKHWLTWRKVALAAGLFCVVVFAQKWQHLSQIESEYQSYHLENERIFRAALPGKKRIPTVSYLKREIENEVAAMSGGSLSNGALDWVAKIPNAFAQTSNMELLSLKFDGQRGELTLQVQGNDFQPFEQLRAELAKDFDVEQGQLSKDQDLVFGSYILKEQS